MIRRLVGTVTIGLLGVALFAGTALGAHNGNNRAYLTGTDPDVAGVAIVNYAEGTGTFSGSVTVSNLEPGETYYFFVRGATGETLVCTGTANEGGTFTCSAQQLALPGFGIAVVRDDAGAEVAGGTFDRRGNCRDPQQGGSQCMAPGQN